MSLDFLYLNEPDMIKAGVLDMRKCVSTIDEMFGVMGKGDYLMGSPSENHHGMMLWFPDKKRTGNMPVAGPDRRFMAMPGYLGGRFNVCGNKWYGSNRENTNKGIPRSILTFVLNDTDTGAPLAFMSANLLSSTRTGAVPGVATKYLQRKGASVLGIIGAGVVSRSCLLAIACTMKDAREVLVYDIIPGKAASFCLEMSKATGLNMRPVGTMEEAVRNSDVISIAASGTSTVEIPDEWLKPGSLFLITGTAVFSANCYMKNKTIFDNWLMHKDWMDELITEPERLMGANAGHPSAPLLQMIARGEADAAKMISLGDVLVNPGLGRTSDDDIIVFISGGMATEDIAWGFDVYQEALRQGIGTWLKLWDKPHWA